MARVSVVIVLSVFLLVGSGCAMCNSEFDHDYAAFGGAWDRHTRGSGRVGSAFDSGGERVAYGTAQTLDEQSEEDAPAESDEGMEGPSVPDTSDAPDENPT